MPLWFRNKYSGVTPLCWLAAFLMLDAVFTLHAANVVFTKKTANDQVLEVVCEPRPYAKTQAVETSTTNQQTGVILTSGIRLWDRVDVFSTRLVVAGHTTQVTNCEFKVRGRDSCKPVEFLDVQVGPAGACYLYKDWSNPMAYHGPDLMLSAVSAADPERIRRDIVLWSSSGSVTMGIYYRPSRPSDARMIVNESDGSISGIVNLEFADYTQIQTNRLVNGKWEVSSGEPKWKEGKSATNNSFLGWSAFTNKVAIEKYFERVTGKGGTH